MKKALKLFLILAVTFIVLPSSAQVLDAPKKIVNRAWEKNESKDGKVERKLAIPYSYLRESDVFWAKRIWRQMDLREKINLPIYYPEPQVRDRMSMTQVLWQAVVTEGTVRAYLDEDFTDPTTATEIKASTEGIEETKSVTKGGEDTIIKTQITFESKEVKKYLIKEDWFFDKQRSVLDVRIIGICPIKELYITDDQGNKTFKGYKQLFWLYFPEVRDVFCKYELYNRQNDAERMSYDDMFHKRMFGSYITKTENVFDRVIGDYETGLDALIEGERIKEDIFSFEQDLWEY